MAVEAKLSGEKVELRRKHPYLGRASNGEVVLFISANSGTCIVNVNNKMGETSNSWVEQSFTPLSPAQKLNGN